MSENLLAELRRYVRFTADDEAALRAFHPHASPHFEAIAVRFYERINEHPEAAQVLQGREQVERLRVSLVDWLDTLLRGPWDEAYYHRRVQIGQMHVRVRLPQRYMFGAMAVIRGQLQDIAQDALASQPTVHRITRSAIAKILDLELAIMLDSYGAETLQLAGRLQRLERDRLERRLEATEARYHEVIENAEIVIVAVDRGGHLNLFNRKAEELTGFARQELRGAPAHEAIGSPEGAERIRAAFEVALAGQSPEPFESPLLSRAGEERLLRWHVVPMPPASEIGACAFGVDITHTRRLERASRRAERLAALGTLAAGLAHEIRNPLNSANLQLTLAERRMTRMDDAESRAKAVEALQVVQQEVRRLAGMVEDFLAFARPRPLRIGAGDLRATAAGVVALLAPHAEQAGVAVHLDAGEVVAARYDAEQITQLFHNLIRNGIEAAGDGGHVVVHVDRDPAIARVTIIDDGPGPPPGVDIFAPFFTTKEGGTGLGLPIVHRIVTDHGGEITFERRGEQTVFQVELPLDGPPAARPAV